MALVSRARALVALTFLYLVVVTWVLGDEESPRDGVIRGESSRGGAVQSDSSVTLLVADDARKPVVRTSLGTYRGTRRSLAPAGGVQVDEFLGVRYAVPPTGARRFLVAEPINVDEHNVSEEDIIEASSYGDVCMQDAVSDPLGPGMSEDCLFLNIWTPTIKREDQLLPVMFWIHGGSLQFGAGSLRWYNGSRLASLDSVVVTINYRLGPLGFLPTDTIGSGGLNGMHDQILALKWVQQHISHFHGDPSRVTVFGESAGSISTCVLAVSPLAEGLFQRAILESGPCTGVLWGVNNKSVGQNVAQEFLAQRHAATVADLRLMPAEELVKWTVSISGSYAFVDGFVLEDMPAVYYAKGKINGAEFIVGANSKEGITIWGDLMEYLMTGLHLQIPISASEYDWYLKEHFGHEIGQSVAATYTLSRFNGDAASAYVQADGDAAVVCPIFELVNWINTAGKTVYHYAFEYGGASSDIAVMDNITPYSAAGSNHWASHASEIPFVFGNRCGPPWLAVPRKTPYTVCLSTGETWLKVHRDLSKTVMELWSSFAKGGVPVAEGLNISWRAAGKTEVETLVLDTPVIKSTFGYRSDLCKFWQKWYDSKTMREKIEGHYKSLPPYLPPATY